MWRLKPLLLGQQFCENIKSFQSAQTDPERRQRLAVRSPWISWQCETDAACEQHKRQSDSQVAYQKGNQEWQWGKQNIYLERNENRKKTNKPDAYAEDMANNWSKHKGDRPDVTCPNRNG